MTLLTYPPSLGLSRPKSSAHSRTNHSTKRISWRRLMSVLPSSIVLPLGCAPLAKAPLDLKSLYLVQRRLQEDLLGCEALWIMFVAAALSYRYKSRLRPFPRSCLSIDHLCHVLADVPRLEMLHQQFLLSDYQSCTPNVVRLLSDVLVDQADRVSLTSLRPSEFEDLYNHLGMPPPDRTPTQIFEVRSGQKNRRAATYNLLSKQNKDSVRLGFCGCQLEKLYALLNDESLPEGKYLELTSDVNEALARSKPQAGVGGSKCGSILRCVAVVEFVFQGNATSPDKKHVIVSDADTMQVSYLMIYGQTCEEHEAEMELMTQPGRKLINWIGSFEQDALSLGVGLLIVSSMAHFGSSFFRLFARTGFHILKRGLL
ncbi:hypothetical protein KR067_001107 [Drosophila pandora]|nr:hypothetical protein KR067_001107 [Drosophila pandora]